MTLPIGARLVSLVQHVLRPPEAPHVPVDHWTPDQVHDELQRFNGSGWRMFKLPGINAQIVSDSTGTWAHSKATFVVPGMSFAHSHSQDQRTTVLHGALCIKVGGYPSQVLTAGESVYIPPNVRHRITVLSPQFEAIDEWHPRRSDMKPTE
jgi:mannose-6-phosphate isomerase-like protein (cupin superfamily)